MYIYIYIYNVYIHTYNIYVHIYSTRYITIYYIYICRQYVAYTQYILHIIYNTILYIIIYIILYYIYYYIYYYDLLLLSLLLYVYIHKPLFLANENWNFSSSKILVLSLCFRHWSRPNVVKPWQSTGFHTKKSW